jgi:flagellar hook-basal body complex protein FliE
MTVPGVGGWATAAIAPAEIAPAATSATATASTVETAPFGDLLKSAVSGVNELQQQASTAVTGLLSGDGVDIHDAMIATQKADMAFELALAVRNKAVAAYQQVMGMQF